MRGGKDEEQVISPKFPRFHVNDTEKGGPRAPPRNKMALYEQFSIPSQSFTCGSASMLPFAHNDSSSLVPLPSTSESDVSVHERNILTPPCSFHVMPSYAAEKIQSCTSPGAKLNTMMADCERISTKSSNYLHGIGSSSSAAKCDSFQPKKSSSCSLKKFGTENCLRAPTAFQGTALPFSREREMPYLSSTVQLKSSCIKQMNGRNTIDPKSGQYGRNQDEENLKLSNTIKDPVERSVSLALAIMKDFATTSSSPSNTVRSSESLKRTHVSMSQENRSSMNYSSKLCSSNVRLCRESMNVDDRVALKDDIFVQSSRGAVKEISSKVREKSCLTPSIANDNRISDGLENNSEFCEKNDGVVRVGNLGGHEDISGMDCNSAVGISPDDVIGVIGAKEFCKTRKAIVNQQRVFAKQVFELHRLIKVQRLIAGSPNILLEGNDFLGKPTVKVPPVKKVPLEHALASPSVSVKPKDHSQKPHSSVECAAESAVAKFALPSANNGTSSRGQSNNGQYSSNGPPASGATNIKPALWSLQPPPGNLWFVPVMSPSEGLAYKPYTGPCPPIGGFMAPMYGSCGPASLHSGTRDYLNAAYGVPSTSPLGIEIGTPPLLRTYFPPYGLPIVNPSVSSPAFENMTAFSGGHSKVQENQLSFGEIKFTTPHQSSCNMSNQMRQVMPCHKMNVKASKGSELQGSTASSPADGTIGDALPLFPMAPQHQEPAQNAQTYEHQTRAIKVVPHNTKSAAESVARIFLSIQEERK